MTAGDQIQYLPNKEINKEKWDSSVEKASNGLIYGYSFYLDHMSRHWDALILNDYEAIMPLTWNKKYGFYYLYQPAFIASLGVFGKNIDGALVKKFVQALPSKFKLIEISLNHDNNFPSVMEGYYPRTNYVLELNRSYDELLKNYRHNHKRNIAKAIHLGCSIKKEVSVDEIIRIHKQQLKHIDGTKPEDYSNFKKLYESLKSKGQAKTYAVGAKDDKILASAVFFFSHQRAYYILAGNHPDGKTLGASHALIDAFIKDHAEQNLVLDFEGSDIRNLAFFYSGFGAMQEIYPGVRINKLPWYVRLLKK